MESPGVSYDMNADALYRQYRDAYARRGGAMEDAMGQASALTGATEQLRRTAGQQVTKRHGVAAAAGPGSVRPGPEA